jgi:hypothetical protein
MELHERLGPTSYIYGTSGADSVVAEYRERGTLDPENVTTLGINTAHIHLFGPDGVSVRSNSGAVGCH